MPDSQPSDPERPVLEPGSVIGPCRILGLIGRGGIGEVYEVKHQGLGKRFALKVIRPEALGGPVGRERFSREAQVMVQIDHPHLLPVDEVREEEGLPCLRMPLMPGIATKHGIAWTLENLIAQRGGQLGEQEATHYLRQILKGLACAHGHRLVHGDLKPANILMSKEGIRIADFGLAGLVDPEWFASRVRQAVAESRRGREVGSESEQDTSTRALLGTYHYMSPEQKDGFAAEARSDLYAVGLIAFRMLTGKLVGTETLIATELAPGIASGWNAWFKRALHPDPAWRFATAEEALAALPGGKRKRRRNVPFSLPPVLSRSLAAMGIAGAVVAGAWFLFDWMGNRTGDVMIRSTPSGALVIAADGEILGNTPVEVAEVVPGPVHYEVEKDGYETQVIHDRLEPGGTLTLEAALPPLTGGVELTSEPPGAWVELEGQRKKTPAKFTGLKPGRYVAKLSMEGYAETEARLEIKAGESVNLPAVMLQLLTGGVEIKSKPTGAWVELGGQRQRTPAKFSGLKPGTFTAELSMEGYREAELQAEITAGETVNLPAVALEKELPVSSSPSTATPAASMEKGSLAFAGTRAGQEITNDLGMKFCWCPPGEFTMGSPRSELGRGEDENQVEVRLSQGFWLGKYEVTQGQWESVMGTDVHDQRKKTRLDIWGIRGAGSDFPMYFLTFEETVEFCRKLTARERAAGRLPKDWEYRLPTEAQWEYACRAATRSSLNSGKEVTSENGECPNLNELAWYGSNSGGKTHEVGLKRANRWGLHDMHGNVWEFCRGWYGKKLEGGIDPAGPSSGPGRIDRGGGWHESGPESCRSAKRFLIPLSLRVPDLGFRVAAVPTSATASAGKTVGSPPVVRKKEPLAFVATQAGKEITNSLGMKFVPVGKYTDGTLVLFCEHETRVQDYAAYAAENRGIDLGWKNSGFLGHGQEPDHPVVNVSWEDAKAFCAWLTKKERAAGRIGQQNEYRLPTDVEWSYAVGIGEREDAAASPKEKDEKIEGVYPWGKQWPPPRGAGNYHGQESAGSFQKLDDYRDNHPFTAPVKSYGPNRFGLYDLGGNVWEWCEDWFSSEQVIRVLRGGSWRNFTEVNLRSSFRVSSTPASRYDICGFRVGVVVGVGG